MMFILIVGYRFIPIIIHILSSMRKVIMLLILLALLVSVDSQWSYIPSRMFASCKRQIIKINLNASMSTMATRP